jgi:hypothetical protein
VNTKAGRVDTCGYRFTSVVKTIDGRLLGVDGSINTSYFKDKVPGLLIKVFVAEIKSATPKPRKLHFALLRVGAVDTKSMKQLPTEDGNSYMFYTDMLQTDDFFLKFSELFPKGAWVSLSLDPTKGDYTYRLPAFASADADTLTEVAQCSSIGFDNLMSEMKK